VPQSGGHILPRYKRHNSALILPGPAPVHQGGALAAQRPNPGEAVAGLHPAAADLGALAKRHSEPDYPDQARRRD